MLKLILFLAILNINAFASGSYPKAPDVALTPGSLCDTPDYYRHPEQIPYCERNVNSFMKETIFISYKNLGYTLSGQRNDYKIDHFIPLCFGGSNNQDNLWPQHISLSKITDSIEAMGCEKLGKAKISQKDLLELIVRAKLNLQEAPRIFEKLKRLK